ncbi:MAG: caspase family protein, partial [Anaerolineae bacterium]|nr:caspase family protein [Anaerolineae bacterium]
MSVRTMLATLLILAAITGCAAPTPTVAPAPTLMAIPAVTPTHSPRPAGDGVVNGWAVLAEKDDYSDVEMTDLPVDYINVIQLHQLLLDFGWQEERIRELREFDQENLRQALDWLADNADEDDVVFFYVTAHSSFLREVVRWRDFFVVGWVEVPSQRRVLVVDSCQAAIFTAAVNDASQPNLSIAAVDEDEYGWAGLEEEGLPIIGDVFTHYFAAAFGDPEADTDGDGFVSAQEAALMAEEQQRAYMHDVVFAVPEFVESYHDIGAFSDQDPTFPTVVVDDTIGEPLYLALDAYPTATATT